MRIKLPETKQYTPTMLLITYKMALNETPCSDLSTPEHMLIVF